jgi:hypothetical protein
VSYGSAAAGRSAFVHGSGDGGIVVSGSAGGSAANVIFGNNWGTNGATFSEEYRIFMDGSNDSLKFNYNANASTALTLSNTGAATFSSSVTATKGIFTQTGGDFAAVFTTPFDYIAKFESTDSAAFIVLEDNNSTTNANRIGAVGDSIQIESGNVENALFTSTASVFNENSADMDFRVEGTSLAYLLNVSDDTVKINANASGATGGWTFYPTGSGSSPYVVQNKTSTSDTRAYAFQVNSSTKGSIDYDNNGTQFLTTSDRRLKMDIQPIVDGTEKLMAMNAVTHKWIENPEKDAVHGFIAQEMQEIAPESISGVDGGEEMMSMDYGRITPILVAALQDAHNKIKTLETRLATLEEK